MTDPLTRSGATATTLLYMDMHGAEICGGSGHTHQEALVAAFGDARCKLVEWRRRCLEASESFSWIEKEASGLQEENVRLQGHVASLEKDVRELRATIEDMRNTSRARTIEWQNLFDDLIAEKEALLATANASSVVALEEHDVAARECTPTGVEHRLVVGDEYISYPIECPQVPVSTPIDLTACLVRPPMLDLEQSSMPLPLKVLVVGAPSSHKMSICLALAQRAVKSQNALSVFCTARDPFERRFHLGGAFAVSAYSNPHFESVIYNAEHSVEKVEGRVVVIDGCPCHAGFDAVECALLLERAERAGIHVVISVHDHLYRQTLKYLRFSPDLVALSSVLGEMPLMDLYDDFFIRASYKTFLAFSLTFNAERTCKTMPLAWIKSGSDIAVASMKSQDDRWTDPFASPPPTLPHK